MESNQEEIQLTQARPRKWSITPFRVLVLLFGLGLWALVGSYYFSLFPIRQIHDPFRDLLVIKTDDPQVIALFRGTALIEYLEPASELNARMVSLRKESRAGTVIPTDVSLRCEALAIELRTLMNDAEREKIPQVDERSYLKLLIAISEIYSSLRAFETALAENDPDERQRELRCSILLTKSAKAKLDDARRKLIKPTEQLSRL